MTTITTTTVIGFKSLPHDVFETVTVERIHFGQEGSAGAVRNFEARFPDYKISKVRVTHEDTDAKADSLLGGRDAKEQASSVPIAS